MRSFISRRHALADLRLSITNLSHLSTSFTCPIFSWAEWDATQTRLQKITKLNDLQRKPFVTFTHKYPERKFFETRHGQI